MKRKSFLLAIFSLVCGVSALAADIPELLQDGRRWNYYWAAGLDSYSYYYSRYVDGDTVIGSLKCKKVYKQREGRQPERCDILHEDGGRVWVWLGAWRLLYDFRLEAGGRAYDYGYEQWLDVVQVDTVGSCGRQYRRVVLSSEFQYDVEWVCSVGGSGDLLNSFGSLSGSYGKLLSCEQDGMTIFTYDALNTYPLSPSGYSKLSRGDLWEYANASGFRQKGDTISGDFNTMQCSTLHGHTGEAAMYVDGKPYMPFRMASPAAEAESGMDLTDLAEHDYSDRYIGIRREGSRVLVNRSNYLRHVSGEGENDGLYRYYGDASYIPYRTTDDGKELILYDYDMEPGDTYVHVSGHEDITVTSKDQVLLGDGHHHRRLVLSNGMEIIDGVGCTNSPGLLLFYLNPNPSLAGMQTVLSYTDYTGGHLYTSPYTIVGSGMADTPSLQPSTTAVCHDLQGRRISGKPSHGIYIVNGRKYRVK